MFFSLNVPVVFLFNSFRWSFTDPKFTNFVYESASWRIIRLLIENNVCKAHEYVDCWVHQF